MDKITYIETVKEYQHKSPKCVSDYPEAKDLLLEASKRFIDGASFEEIGEKLIEHLHDLRVALIEDFDRENAKLPELDPDERNQNCYVEEER